MKIVAINGSPRKNGNNARLLEVVRAEVEKAGVEFEVVQPGANVKPCLACYRCLDTGSLRCVQDDAVNAIIEKCIEADGILLTSPVYHAGISGNMKCVLDRMMLAAACGENQFHHKVGGALCTLRRSGGSEVYHAWNSFYLKEQGWVTVEIQARPNIWQRVDITFAAAGVDTKSLTDDSLYTTRYTY